MSIFFSMMDNNGYEKINKLMSFSLGNILYSVMTALMTDVDYGALAIQSHKDHNE